MFAELHCTSAFTFLVGASQPEELVWRAAELGYRGLALTDECSLAGVVRAHRAACEYGLQLVVGSSLRVRMADESVLNLVLLVPDRQAYNALVALITRARRRADKGDYILHQADLTELGSTCLCLWCPTLDHHTDARHGGWLNEHFHNRLWIACELLQQGRDAEHYLYLRELAENLGLPVVAANDVHMHEPQRQPLQEVLTALRLGVPVQQLGRQRFPNAERHLRPLSRLRRLYPPALLAESLRIVERCSFSLSELRYRYPRGRIPPGMTPIGRLHQLALEGAGRRWPDGMPERIGEQLRRELALVEELEYEHYFLTVHEIVDFARNRDILCQGRGSAANSVLCYCLFITEVDPAHSQLLFERFISRERNEPPDIDVDFEHERREEVIAWILEKYGRDHAALAATVSCWRMRSAVRDVGRALDFDADCIERLVGTLAGWDTAETLAERFREAGLADTPMAGRYQKLVTQLLGMPRHLSQHSGGFVISAEPLQQLVPVENTAMAERTCIQWDKEDLESLGLMKVDVLSLGMLTAIRKTLDSVNQYLRIPLTLQRIPPEDEATYTMLARGDSVGVFQVESRAQMNMLPRLRPRTFYDLVVEVAIVRPGPIQGEMVHPYLRRRDGLEPVNYPDPRIRQVLERTLGVPIFQEQIIQLAMTAADFSGGEADSLRRAMARWGKTGELLQFRDRMIRGMLDNGYSRDYAERIFEQMKGFGGYGFPESHAASFALLVYVSAWLKRHHTAAFYCGLLNSQPMGFHAPAQLIRDARDHGIEVRPPDVLTSYRDWTIEETSRYRLGMQPALRTGLRQIRGCSARAAARIVAARAEGPFRGLRDLCLRAGLDQGEREALVAGGALNRLSGHRNQAHWEMQAVRDPGPLFRDGAGESLRDGVALDAPSEPETLLDDYRSLGLSTGRHPLALVRHLSPFRDSLRARDLRQSPDGRLVRVTGLVTNRQRPGSAAGVMFMTLEDETGYINLVLWQAVQERFRSAVLGGRLLHVLASVERSPEGLIHLIAGRVEDVTGALAELRAPSRDFR